MNDQAEMTLGQLLGHMGLMREHPAVAEFAVLRHCREHPLQWFVFGLLRKFKRWYSPRWPDFWQQLDKETDYWHEHGLAHAMVSVALNRPVPALLHVEFIRRGWATRNTIGNLIPTADTPPHILREAYRIDHELRMKREKSEPVPVPHGEGLDTTVGYGREALDG